MENLTKNHNAVFEDAEIIKFTEKDVGIAVQSYIRAQNPYITCRDAVNVHCQSDCVIQIIVAKPSDTQEG